MRLTINNKKVLITGGAGFIGSHLVAVLLQQGNQVVALDNFATGKIENISDHIGRPDFKLLEGDIRNMEDCRQAVEGVEIVLHQAALGSVPRSINDPVTSNEVNISGFLNMLVAARDAGVSRFVYAASSSTYGDHPGLPKVEGQIGKPLSPYAVTKYVNELYADVFARTYDMQLVGLRYFNVFGPRQDPNGAYAAVIPKFIGLLLQHQSPVINGDGTHSRDFTYIDNVVQMNQLAATTDNPEAINQVYNVACGEQTDLNQLFEHLKQALTEYDQEIARVKVEYGSERKGDIKHSLADISKAEKLLGFQPEVKVSEGLQKTAEWFYKNNKKNWMY
jgi:UDP-N-acetylglucosamine 4-epimerase